MRASHWSVLLAASIMYGSAFSLTSVAVAELPPLSVAAGRAVTAACALALILALTGGRLPATLNDWRPLAVLGILGGALPFAALAWGQVHVQSSIAGILFGITPVLTLVIAHFLTPDDRVTRWRLSGVILGFAGVAIVVGPGSLAGLGRDLASQASILFAALCIGCGAVYARRHSHISPLALSAGSSLCAAALLLPLSLAFDGASLVSGGFGATAAVLGLGIVGTALPTPGVYWLIRAVGATTSTLLAFFMPVMAVLGGVVALKEELPATALAGLGLILGGAVLASRRG